MTIKVSVATPTPHYDYTVRYNHHLDTLAHQRKIDHVKENQKKWADYYDMKRKHVDELHRIEKAHQRKVELEQVHQYEILDKKHAYYDYRYQFYVGTLFDAYI